MQQDYKFPIFHYAPLLPHFQMLNLHNFIFPFWKLGAFMLEGSRKSCCQPPRIQTLDSKIPQLTCPGSLLLRSRQWFRVALCGQHTRRAIEPSMTWSGLFRATSHGILQPSWLPERPLSMNLEEQGQQDIRCPCSTCIDIRPLSCPFWEHLAPWSDTSSVFSSGWGKPSHVQ